MSEHQNDANDSKFEDYRVPGTSMFSLSRYNRDNHPPAPPRFKVGDVVYIYAETEIVKAYQDVDGSPIYEVDAFGVGISESELLAHDELATLRVLLTRALERIDDEDAASANGDESDLARDLRAAAEGDAP